MTTLDKLTNLRDRIKVAFAEFDNPPQEEVAEELADYFESTLESGETVRATPALAVGSVLSLVSESGDIPAPDGSHTLTDGTVVVVLDGIISEIVLPETEEMSEVKAELSAIKAENESLKQSIETAKSESDVKFTELEAKITKQFEFSSLLNEAFIALSEAPTTVPTQPVVTETVQMSAQDLMRNQANKFQELRNKKFNK
jgi:hypothetical protein